MEEALKTVAETWNDVTRWSGRAKEFAVASNLEIPRWLQHLIVFCVLYSTFTLTSAYYLLFSKRRLVTRQEEIPVILLKLRVLLALCLATCPVIQLVLKVHDESVTWIDMTVCGFMMFGWLVHQQYLRIAETEMIVHHAGHAAVNLSWLLTVVALAYQISFTIFPKNVEIDLRTKFDLHILLATIFFQGLYFLIIMYSMCFRSDGRRRRFILSSALKYSIKTLIFGVTSTFSQLTFAWVDTLMNKGSNRMITNADHLINLPSSLRSKNLDKQFVGVYQQLKLKGQNKYRGEAEVSRHLNSPRLSKQVSLFEALVKCFGYQYFLLGFLKLGTDCIGFVAPVLLNKLLAYLESDGIVKKQAYYYAGCLCLCTLTTTLLNSQFFFLIYQVALQIRAAVITTVYRKALSTNANELMKLNLGELVNYMSNDADRILNFCPNFHNLWSLPLQILTCMYLLYTQVEFAALCGMTFGMAVIYTNFHLAKKIARLSDHMMTEKDSRVKLMSETLHGIHVVKFNAWERHFIRWISGLRETEVASLSVLGSSFMLYCLFSIKGRKYLDAVCVYFWATSSLLISFLTFFTYVFIFGKVLTTAKVFTSLALINILLLPLNVFPWTVNGLMEAWVSLKRIEKLLTLPELNHDQYYSKLSELSLSSPRKRVHLEITDGVFVWGDMQHPAAIQAPRNVQKNRKHETTVIKRKTASKKFVLGPIDFNVMEGNFIGIFGQVGSGKTSLLHAIMGEMWKTSGTISVQNVEKGFGYVSQEAWIQNGTIKDNILFGAPLDHVRYQTVLECCALTEDLEKLPAGDSTEIGERAITLSGGQKARLALARAIYQNKKLYLLDHPFATVDSHVAHHIFNNCIRGLLVGSTRIMCTHQMNLLFHADYVYIMKDGKIIEKGSPAAVFEQKLSTSTIVFPAIVMSHESEFSNSLLSQRRRLTPSLSLVELDDKMSEASLPMLINEEEMAEGTMKFRVYKFYLAAVGRVLAPFIVMSLFLMQVVSRNATDWWLAYWLAQYSNIDNNTNLKMTHTSAIAMEPNIPSYKDAHSYNVYVYRAITMVTNYDDLDELVCEQQFSIDNDGSFFMIYTCLVVANSVVALLRAFLYARGGVVAAVNIHNTLVYQMFKAPMLFFHSTPVGRILNRFSTDIYAIDNTVPFMLNIFLAQLLGLFGILIISCYGVPWILVLLIPLFLYYLKMQSKYRNTSRDVKRISLVTLSSLYAHFSETFAGLITIRALKAEKRFIDLTLEYLERSQKAIYAIQIAGIWLSLRLHMIGVIILSGIAGAVLHSNKGRSEFSNFISNIFLLSEDLMNKAIVCLTMTYALTITNMLNNLVWSFTEMEKEMVSCERILHYSESMGSEQWKGTVIPDEQWPMHGRISFDNASLQYEMQGQVALKNINLQVFPGEKIGIVGRTGSGKSSLFRALFRLEELVDGRILVDGLDIKNIDLSTLRSRMAVIPQEAFVFSGTVRDNLDPNRNYNSYELWTVLQQCHVIDAVHRVGGLDVIIRDAGKDFSTGQKQLLCLARALLNNAQILCIDEVTANVDHETDHIIHKTIDLLFSNKTVLIIAHRIENVLNCNRVIVLSRGEVIEEDNPQKLLSQSSSEFYKLASRVLGSYSKSVVKQSASSRPKLSASVTF